MPGVSTYTDEIADVICDRLSNGESLRTICSEEGQPSQSMVFRWLQGNAAFRENYTRAREAQADAIFDEILHISNTPVVGEKTKISPNGEVEVTTGDMIEHRRLQIEARKWMAGKLRPKKYGDKIEMEHSGSLQVTTKEQRDAAVAAATRADS